MKKMNKKKFMMMIMMNKSDDDGHGEDDELPHFVSLGETQCLNLGKCCCVWCNATMW
jgi:hypothetical protein